MRRTIGVLLAVAGIAAAGTAWFLAPRAELVPAPPEAPTANAAHSVADTDADPEPAIAPTPEVSEPDTPAIRDYAAYKAFESRLRAFLEQASTLSLEARLAEAAALSVAIDTEEQAGRLRPVESMMLRLALARQTTTDPASLAREAQALARALDAQAAARVPPPADARFDDYKSRETEIVREVLTLPPGPERDALLRKRLEQARVEAYRR